MKKITILLLLAASFLASCRSTSTGIFSRTPREKYEDRLEDRKLDQTPAGREWLSASQKALLQAQAVQLPYRLNGYFPAGKPRALGLAFPAHRGEKIEFELDRSASPSLPLYVELFRVEDNDHKLVHAADTAANSFSYDIEDAGNYILRLQPELFRAGYYKLSIASGPSLGFPVSGSKAYVGSVWGDVRDGGKRSHEGIDIFAAKRTPAIAAADGYISSVREGGLGGKTVWLRPEGKDYTLYYAHLDVQLVKEGQFVKKGETLGLVGNTGNARTTPSHLHFGIYTFNGAINPLPFINRTQKANAVAPDKKIPERIRLVKDFKSGEYSVKAQTFLVPVGVAAKGYLAELPDGKIVHLPFAFVGV